MMRAAISTKPDAGRSIYRGHPLACGLIGCWLLNERSGKTAQDSVRRANGTLTNAPTWIGSPKGGTISFDAASSQYIALGSPSWLQQTNTWTVEGMTRRTSSTGQAMAMYSPGRAWFLKCQSSGEYSFGSVARGDENVGVTSVVDAWEHWVWTFDGSNTQRFYLNGRKRFTGSNTTANGTPTVIARIAAWDDGGGNPQRYWPGQISWIRVWNRVLSDSDIFHLYAEPFDMFAQSRHIVWIPASGGTVFDISPSGAATPAGAVTKVVAKVFTGAGTPAGALSAFRTIGASLIGAVATAGAMLNAVSQSLTGGASSSGSLSKAVSDVLAGAAASAGTIASLIAKPFTASAVVAGSIAKAIAKPFAGADTPVGTLTALRAAFVSLTGGVDSSSSLTRAIAQGLSAASISAGSFLKACAKPLSAASTPAGGLSKSDAKPSVASITSAGSVANLAGKGLSGAVAIAGTIGKVVASLYAGAISASGALAKAIAHPLTGVITSSGVASYVRSVLLGLSATVSSLGGLAKSIAKPLARTSTPASDLRKSLSESFLGFVSSIGNFIGALLGGGIAENLAVTTSVRLSTNTIIYSSATTGVTLGVAPTTDTTISVILGA